MSISNEQLIQVMLQKGLITSGDLANGGKLNPKQADRFIDFVIDETGLDKMARIERFRNEQMQIDKIGVGRRVTVPATEARDPAVRRGITTSKVTLTPVKLMTPFEISDEFGEHNIEGDAVEDTIVRMMATQTGNDMEELMILGDILGPAALESDLLDGGSTTGYIKDTFLALFNGWLRKADNGNLVDFDGQAISNNVFSRMLNAMPNKYRRQRNRLRFLVSDDLEQLYREKVSTRATAAGDRAAVSADNLTPFGVPLLPISLFPFNPTTVEHLTFTGANTTVSLRYNNVESGSVVVLPSTLASAATTPYVEGTDYSVDEVAGTVTQISTGSIGATDTVKITYGASPQCVLTHMDNLILAIGRDIQIEKDRDIFAQLNQWAISTKIDVQYEELEAVVKGYNIANAL